MAHYSALDIPCLACNAKIGEHCNLRRPDGVHIARHEDAQTIGEEMADKLARRTEYHMEH